MTLAHIDALTGIGPHVVQGSGGIHAKTLGADADPPVPVGEDRPVGPLDGAALEQRAEVASVQRQVADVGNAGQRGQCRQ